MASPINCKICGTVWLSHRELVLHVIRDHDTGYFESVGLGRSRNMAHAERCIICNGTGKLPNPNMSPPEITCHGCGGVGWVTVGDDNLWYTFPIKISKDYV